MARMKKMRQPSRQVAMRKFNLFALEKIERGRFQARTGVRASPCTLGELNSFFVKENLNKNFKSKYQMY